MNQRFLLALLVVELGCTSALLRAAAPLTVPPADFTPGTVLSVMEQVADWQLANPSTHSPTDWTQGAGDTGMMALAGTSSSPRFLDAMMKMSVANEWKLGPRPYHADDHCVGQTYAELFFRSKDPAMIAPMRARFDWILAHPSGDNLDFDATRNPDRLDRWSWCDALFMGPPAWIRLYVATGEKAYLDFMVEKWWKTSEYLYDQKDHLYFRDSSYFDRREANGEKIFWSRGNGWVMAGLVRVLQYLPADHPARPRFLQQYREMADKILACQQADGLWRSSLLDPANYPLKETSGSGFYCYALAWGVNQGLIHRGIFEPAVRKAWQSLAGCVTPEGKLTHVQPIGADPKKFDDNATEVYGVGAFLLAGSEVCRLVNGGKSTGASPR
jgi:unsaturated rhamnogalacturonyl hydrolase